MAASGAVRQRSHSPLQELPHGFHEYLALADRAGHRHAGFGTKKLKNIGGDLGAAVKSFKEGVREATDETPANGSSTAQGTRPASPNGASGTAANDANTIDVEARTKG